MNTIDLIQRRPANQAVLSALNAELEELGHPMTGCQEWFVEMLRRLAGDGTDSCEGIGYLGVCEASKDAIQDTWLVAQGYSVNGAAHPDYQAELRELTTLLQRAADTALALG